MSCSVVGHDPVETDAVERLPAVDASGARAHRALDPALEDPPLGARGVLHLAAGLGLVPADVEATVAIDAALEEARRVRDRQPEMSVGLLDLDGLAVDLADV